MSVLSSAGINLKRLIGLRAIVLAGLVLAVWIARARLHLPLPLEPLAMLLTVVLAVHFASWVRLYVDSPVTDPELFAHLVLDVVALTVFLYYTGGSTNPFTVLFLLPLTLTAAALPGRYTAAMLALTVGTYSLLLAWYLPLPAMHTAHADVDDFGLHVLGMWLGFLVSATLIAFFAVNMANTLRERDRLRAEMRERELKHERVVALGALAAGAAHELGTPLSTMAVVVNDIAPDAPVGRERLQTLRAQIERCRQILSTLSAAAGHTRAESGRRLGLDAYLEELLARWRAMRPTAGINYQADGTRPAPQIVAEQTLSQTVLSILNNAADASPDEVAVHARWSDAELVLEVCDRGPGLSAAARGRAGKEPFTTKAEGEGLGLGLFLAHTTIERLGGRVVLYNREGGGACCRLSLPLAPLRIAA
ncbi:histidine kinase [Sulfurifustis variabilis]|uniref:histidine kinase n=1 Tax=Sulfurifustis variabilis TaxID=1675686 RepID=A0A1B4V028_9GAMM|nr:ATP-binding protein [Sulfurifustis variabilis]BAU46778.1 histidine kinase [Sulfurifustis variabilis]